MKNKFFIFHLIVNNDVYMPDNGYECYYAFVIISTNEESARHMAQLNGGDEVDDYLDLNNKRHKCPFWTDKSKTSCMKCGESYIKEEMILESSFNSG